MTFNLVKKVFIVLVSAVLINFSINPPVKSQAGILVFDPSVMGVLTQILARVNNLPQALEKIVTYVTAWTDPDSSDTSATMATTFQQLGQLIPQELDAQIGAQPTLNNYLLSNDGNNVSSLNQGKALTGSPPNAQTMKYANDLVYSSLLGAPYYTKDPRQNMDYAMNYIVNASGSNLWHEMPTGAFHGKDASKKRYQSYYNTVMAATSFNNYVLSANYADKGQFNTLQKTLIQQASDPATWFVKVGSENIGFVLRQLLMYQSQVFVLLTQMIQLQKQMVSAQAVNTAVLIANNATNENSMASYAKGEQPDF